MRSKATPVSLQFADLRLTGNIVPEAWYTHLRREENRGKGGTTRPFNEAITILSEIVYWYRPTVVRAGEDGTEAGIYSKFKADKLQKSYQNLSDKFGFTKDQVREACRFLVQRGLITLEFRNIVTHSGAVNNVMFVEPVFDEVKRISAPIEGGRHEGQVGALLVPTPYRKYQTPHTENTRTNTEITTESQNTIPQTPLQDKGASKTMEGRKAKAATPEGSPQTTSPRLRGSDAFRQAITDPTANLLLSIAAPGSQWTPTLALTFYRKLRSGRVTPDDVKLLKKFLQLPANGIPLARLVLGLDQQISAAREALQQYKIDIENHANLFNDDTLTDYYRQRLGNFERLIGINDYSTTYDYSDHPTEPRTIIALALRLAKRPTHHKVFKERHSSTILEELSTNGSLRAIVNTQDSVILHDLFGFGTQELQAAITQTREQLRAELEEYGIPISLR